MNPFDLRGPPFLAFYAALAAIAIVVAHLVRRKLEDDGGRAGRISDPYAIAFLRDGPLAAARAAAVSLAKRGLLAEKDGFLSPAPDAGRRTTDPLEQAVLRAGANALKETADTGPYLSALAPRTRDLERRRLLPDAGAKARRALLALGVLLLLGGVAAAKVVIALGRGRTNVGFLVVLALAACVVACVVLLRPRRTATGDRTVTDLGHLLSGLASRGEDRAATLDATELALLVAVFGAAGAASVPLPARHHLFFPPPPARSSPSSSSSSCGGAISSCGSSSSGGSSCGGGGCGGGCGGCGS